MKHFLLSLPIVASSIFSHAQTSLDSLKPKAKDKQVVFAASSHSGFISLKKYVSPKLALRFGFSGNYNVSHSENTSTGYSYNANQEIIYYNHNKTSDSRFSLNLLFGFQRSLGTIKNFEPYAGMDFSIGNSFRHSLDDYNYDNSLGSYQTESKTDRKGTFNPSFGLLPFVGFNYYLSKGIAIGAEYRVYAVGVTLPGNTKSTTTYTFQDGTSLTSVPQKDKTTGVSGSFSGSAYFTLTFLLHCKK